MFLYRKLFKRVFLVKSFFSTVFKIHNLKEPSCYVAKLLIIIIIF